MYVRMYVRMYVCTRETQCINVQYLHSHHIAQAYETPFIFIDFFSVPGEASTPHIWLHHITWPRAVGCVRVLGWRHQLRHYHAGTCSPRGICRPLLRHILPCRRTLATSHCTTSWLATTPLVELHFCAWHALILRHHSNSNELWCNQRFNDVWCRWSLRKRQQHNICLYIVMSAENTGRTRHAGDHRQGHIQEHSSGTSCSIDISSAYDDAITCCHTSLGLESERKVKMASKCSFVMSGKNCLQSVMCWHAHITSTTFNVLARYHHISTRTWGASSTCWRRPCQRWWCCIFAAAPQNGASSACSVWRLRVLRHKTVNRNKSNSLVYCPPMQTLELRDAWYTYTT